MTITDTSKKSHIIRTVVCWTENIVTAVLLCTGNRERGGWVFVRTLIVQENKKIQRESEK